VRLPATGLLQEFSPSMFDWLHNGEGLTVLHCKGCRPASTPVSAARQTLMQAFIGRRSGCVPIIARTQDHQEPVHGIRGPLMRKATAVDWAGETIDIENRFRLGQGEQSYQRCLEHFKTITTRRRPPSNLLTTSPFAHAYSLTPTRITKMVAEYVDAWPQRTIPQTSSPQHRASTARSAALRGATGNGGGPHGWGFSVYDPGSKKSGHRTSSIPGVSSGHERLSPDGWTIATSTVAQQNHA